MGSCSDGRRSQSLNYKAILGRKFTLEKDLNKYTRDNWGSRSRKMALFGIGATSKKRAVRRSPNLEHISESEQEKLKKGVTFGFDFDKAWDTDRD